MWIIKSILAWDTVQINAVCFFYTHVVILTQIWSLGTTLTLKGEAISDTVDDKARVQYTALKTFYCYY